MNGGFQGMYVLAVDVGTTGTKAMLVAHNGTVVTSAYQGYPLTTPDKGFVEQDAEDWWNAFVATSMQCIRTIADPQNIKAVSMSTQGGSLVPVDEHDKPLCPALVWMDSRGSRIREDMLRSRNDEWFYSRTGWKLLSGLNAVKIEWMRCSQPEIFRRTRKFLTTLDYINMKLTGRYVIDPTNAGITNLMNVTKKEWDKDILDDLGIRSDQLPEILPSGSVIGKLSKEASGLLGLDTATVLVNGGHDQYCSAVGAGAIHDGDMILSTGTAWVALAISAKPLFNEETGVSIGAHILDGQWGALTSMPTAGLAMEWFRQKLSPKTSNKEGVLESLSFKAIDETAAGRQNQAKDLLFYPCFKGRGSPGWAMKSKASLLGLSLQHDVYDIARAIMEGVAFETKHVLEVYRNMGYATKSLRILGGATKSSLWMDIIANTVDCSVIRFREPNIACVGAAIIAGAAFGVGVFEDYADGFRKVNGKETVCPVSGTLREAYLEKYDRYKKGMEYTDSFYAAK